MFCHESAENKVKTSSKRWLLQSVNCYHKTWYSIIQLLHTKPAHIHTGQYLAVSVTGFPQRLRRYHPVFNPVRVPLQTHVTATERNERFLLSLKDDCFNVDMLWQKSWSIYQTTVRFSHFNKSSVANISFEKILLKFQRIHFGHSKRDIFLSFLAKCLTITKRHKFLKSNCTYTGTWENAEFSAAQFRKHVRVKKKFGYPSPNKVLQMSVIACFSKNFWKYLFCKNGYSCKILQRKTSYSCSFQNRIYSNQMHLDHNVYLCIYYIYIFIIYLLYICLFSIYYVSI